MNDAAILKELGLDVYIPRETPAPTSLSIIAVSESQADFSPAHQDQLNKIMTYLGFAPAEYTIAFADTPANEKALVSFGTTTHSISAMLQTPAVKREVLHAIQHLRRNA